MLVIDSKQLLDFMCSGKYKVDTFHSCLRFAMGQWKDREGCVMPLSKVNNVIITAFIAAYAGLKKYVYLVVYDKSRRFPDETTLNFGSLKKDRL